MNSKPFSKNDINKYTTLYLQGYTRPRWNYNFALENAVKCLTEYAGRSRFDGFVPEDNGNTVGAITAYSKTWPTIYIDELFAAPDNRGRGDDFDDQQVRAGLPVL